ncbi:MAG: AAA family ATPase [Patescibacteria group bacterium]
MSERKLIRLDENKLSPTTEKALAFWKPRLVGQPHILKELADALELAGSSFREPDHPIKSLFCLGPSGTGKTLTAEVLAEFLFGSNKALLKVECENMRQEHQVATLLGAPPGYIGFQDPKDETGGDFPLFTNWNIYKYHFEMLQEKYEDLLEERAEVDGELKKLDEKQKKLFERHRELQQTTNDLTEKIMELDKEVEILMSVTEYATDQGVISNLRIKWLELKKANSKMDLYTVEGKGIFRELIGIRQKHKELTAKLAKTDEEYYENGLGWDGTGDPPPNLIGVILIDEVEKAHIALHNVLLEVLDKGRTRTSNGLEVNFENCIIIVTGNVASSEIADIMNNSGMGFRLPGKKTKEELGDNIYELAMEKVKEEFSPPFLGRFDSIEVFRPLIIGDMEQVFDFQVQLLREDLDEREFDIKLEVTPDVRAYLVERSMKHMEWGARLLKQRVRKYVRLKMVRLLSTQQLDSGDTLVVGLENQKMIFSKEEKPPEPEIVESEVEMIEEEDNNSENGKATE